MNIYTIKTLYREIKRPTLVNKATYKTIDGTQVIRRDFKLNKHSFYGFRSMTIHYVLIRIKRGKVLKKITKICFKDGDTAALAALHHKLGIEREAIQTDNGIYREAFLSYFNYSNNELSISGGVLKENGYSELAVSFRNVDTKRKQKSLLNDLAESELMNILKVKTGSADQNSDIIESVQAIKESHLKGRNYLLYHYLPSLPEKGKGFHSICKTQEIVFKNMLSTLEFFYGPVGQHWQPDNRVGVKEIYEYKGKHMVHWIHAVRKLFCSDMIFFTGTSLLPGKRPVVECKVLYQIIR